MRSRGVTTKTVDKWTVENDRALNTTSWLQYTTVNREYVDSLTCKMCVRFQDRTLGATTEMRLRIKFEIAYRISSNRRAPFE